VATARSELRRGVACCVLVLLLCSTCAASVVEGHDSVPEEQCLPPWEFSSVDSSRVDVPPVPPDGVGPEHLVLSVLMRTYKSVISPVGGRRCGMYPSCSLRPIAAVRERPALLSLGPRQRKGAQE